MALLYRLLISNRVNKKQKNKERQATDVSLRRHERRFFKSVEQDSIAVEIEENIYKKMHRSTARREFRSWENSLEYMYKVLNDSILK